MICSNLYPNLGIQFLGLYEKIPNLEMDWEGQKLAEQLMQILLLAFAAAAFVTGYVIGSFQMMLLVYLGGGVLTALVIVPNWPLFNRHPLNWLQPSEADLHPKSIREAPTTKKKPLKHK